MNGRARNKSTLTTERVSLFKVWSMDQWSNALDVSAISRPSRRVDLPITNKYWNHRTIVIRSYPSGMTVFYGPYGVHTDMHRWFLRSSQCAKHPALRYVVQCGQYAFSINHHTSSFGSQRSKSFSPWHKRESCQNVRTVDAIKPLLTLYVLSTLESSVSPSSSEYRKMGILVQSEKL